MRRFGGVKDEDYFQVNHRLPTSLAFLVELSKEPLGVQEAREVSRAQRGMRPTARHFCELLATFTFLSNYTQLRISFSHFIKYINERLFVLNLHRYNFVFEDRNELMQDLNKRSEIGVS